MNRWARIAICCCLWTLHAHAQEIQIYSEFQRFDPFGEVVIPDRGVPPREILSPTIARNGHISVHVVITGRAGTNYFLYAASNPPDLVEITIYREYFSHCGTGYCPDWLARQPSPSFGAIPESLEALAGQTTRCYLLDIHARADTPPRRVRVEALLKAGAWQVAPMELRIVAPTIPGAALSRLATHEELAPLDAPASTTAQIQLGRFLAGLAPVLPEAISRLREITQRNAAEDMLLARTRYPELNLLFWSPTAWPGLGAEWYLRVRDFLHRLDP